MRKLIFLIVYLISTTTLSQIFSINNRKELITDYEHIYLGKLNSILTIEDILIPDKKFKCLKPLGKPDSVKEVKVEFVGEHTTFYYSGLEIYMDNMHQPDYRLAIITITEGSELITKDGSIIKPGEHITKHIAVNHLSSVENLERIPFKFPQIQLESSNGHFYLQNGINQN